jgi:hypothetical protein
MDLLDSHIRREMMNAARDGVVAQLIRGRGRSILTSHVPIAVTSARDDLRVTNFFDNCELADSSHVSPQSPH